jgi:hypothetical protein
MGCLRDGTLENGLEVSPYKFGSIFQPIIPLFLDVIEKLLLILDPSRLPTSRTFPLGHIFATTTTYDPCLFHALAKLLHLRRLHPLLKL